MERCRVAVDIGDETLDTVLLVVGAGITGLFVGEGDGQAAV